MLKFPRTAQAIGRFVAAARGLHAAHQKHRALLAIGKAVRLHPQTVAELALSCAVACGFTLHKDGQEYAVYVGGERVEAPSQDAA